MSIKRILMLALALGVGQPLLAAEQPLLIPGKSILYQRILALPGARLLPTPEDDKGSEVTPFTSFFVYERSTHGGENWLRVGTSRHGEISGWLPEKSSMEWNQGLTAVFRNPEGQHRALLFQSKEAIRKLAGQDISAFDKLYRQAVGGKLAVDSQVLAIQPAVNIDIQKDFYLVPIRAHEDIFVRDEKARMIKVSSIPLVSEQPPKPPVKPAPSVSKKTEPKQNFSAGLAFVVDATLSMDPYIDRTREAVMKIYDRLGDADLLGQVNFALVAYRGNPELKPGLEYGSKLFVDLEQGRDPGKFISQVQGLKAARVSTTDFREDAYLGVRQAIEELDWSGQNAKYIILVTDAGAREKDDPLSATGLGTEDIRRMAQQKGIALFVLHLLTPSVKADHVQAAEQYRKLSDYPGIGSLYYAVPMGDVGEYGQAVGTLASAISNQVAQALGSKPVEPEPVVEEAQPVSPKLAELASKVAKLGYALQIPYVQQQPDQRLPLVFDAWMLDRDFADPSRRSLDVAVLLSRDQLSDLHDVLRKVLHTAEEGLLSPQNFLDELKSLAATISRDPERLGTTTATTAGQGHSLAELGFMREYTEDLPYKSEVMNLSLDDWQSWPTRDQIKFLNRLEEKIAYYRTLHDHTDLWISLDKGPVDGDSVFPIPLEMLP